MIKASEMNGCLKGYLVQQAADIAIEKILFDSRKISHPATSLFVPLISDRRNAHTYIHEVYQAGVRCFLVSEDINVALLPGAWIIKVSDTLAAVQKLSAYYRAKFHIPIIGITGSNGKTVIKEWLYQLLEKDYRIVRSPKSFNSQIGVPISVWLLRPDTQLALFEAGISQAGEMERLEKMVKPTIGIFSNIGESHNEGFLNIRHKINEKLLLFKNCDTLIYNKDYHELHDCILQLAAHSKNNLDKEIQLLEWSRKSEALLQITSIEKANGHSTIQASYHGNTIELCIPFIDEASIENCIHCWLTLLHLGVPQKEMNQRFEKLHPVAMRLELIKGINHCTLINDSYNSDVSSFSIALDFLIQQNQHDTKTVILSDILQSGRDNELYDEVAELLKQKKIKRLIGIGETISRNKKIFRTNRSLHSTFYKTTEEFLAAIDSSSFHQECILIKGARKFSFEKIAKRLQERIHQTVMEINLNALIHNYKAYQSLLRKETKIMAMVKAFSYGSGSYEVANKLQFEGVDYLTVAYTDEGILLRKNGITLPIMVMNADENSFDQIIEWKLEPEIYNFRTLDRMLEACVVSDQMAYPIHIKLDTGMHRLGFDHTEMEALGAILVNHKEVRIASIFSHLAGSEQETLDIFTTYQADLFERMTQHIAQQLDYPLVRHLCNSSGIVRHPHLHYDMVRLGLGLYGIDSTGKMIPSLRNVSRLKTSIAQVKKVMANETVGYNRKGVLQRDTLIGTVCIGYADGVPRRLGNGKGFMLLHNTLVPIIGNVCMDMCMLDITDLPETKEGDTVEIFGEQYTVTKVAAAAETIPYEILTGISQRVKRIYFEE
nr:bifunctional UDP-N-acetylmuramoyl-tripeptide:D-alanyl-D-alanine ligase/alanine racemase [Chitinophagaceae bacterium]